MKKGKYKPSSKKGMKSRNGALGSKIKKLKKKGYPQKQAVAKALNMKRKKK